MAMGHTAAVLEELQRYLLVDLQEYYRSRISAPAAHLVCPNRQCRRGAPAGAVGRARRPAGGAVLPGKEKPLLARLERLVEQQRLSAGWWCVMRRVPLLV